MSNLISNEKLINPWHIICRQFGLVCAPNAPGDLEDEKERSIDVGNHRSADCRSIDFERSIAKGGSDGN